MALATGLIAMPSQAGDWRCNGPCYDVPSTQPIHRTFKRQVTIAPGVYEIERRPSLYGWVKHKIRHRDGSYSYVKERILLRPYKNIAVYHKADQRYYNERVTIYPERESWSHFRGSWKGR